MSIFGARVKTLRLEAGWSMKQLGEKIGEVSGTSFAQTTVSNWENKGAEPPYNVLIVIANLFQVSTDYLVGNTQTIQDKGLFLEENQINKDINIKEQEVEQSHEPPFMTTDLYEDLLALPISKKEQLEKQLHEYTEFINYKYDKLQEEYMNFRKYIQYEIKASSSN
ncbi:transcriptional regulator (plasmid) [Bacillus thuringiensis LM1212]|uniref:Transcriptional regulator n=1 Tax=Bacillus thuringiensis TaxID=1428 RepID=A0A9X7G1R8_BACTU|nr:MULTISPECIES: helix-turn-helix domain-containing protein [Bacillus cereus group]MCQ6341887.1 helix-turn-helix domain-containing protein [Bacillus cereus]AXY11384.1 transcriptional regulator [Bacillus thuringiensis LM1212]AZR80574.1 transcriptional regulator [Bacillus thuringiensis]MBG9521542.1 MerR family transcriptional regulator [Bacillus thuringiensis]MED3469963.1 helix-turn-helix domain-containing protein [Bacillus thuringiensis]